MKKLSMNLRNYLFALVLLPTLALGQSIKVIVNESNPLESINRTEVADYFMKRNKQWPDGAPVRFFDRNDDSRERMSFLREVLKKSQREIETFWIGQKLYTGHSAPTQVSSDSMMAALVARFPGAIGYVSDEFAGGKGVKVIELKGN